MALLTRISVGGVGITYGTITDKAESAAARPGDLYTRIAVGGVGQTYAVTDKAAGEVPRPGNIFTRIGVGGVGIHYTVTAKAETGIVVEEQYSGGWFDYEALRPRFKARGKEQKKAKRFIEEIAEQILQSPQVETNRDIELVLRLKLRQQELIYKNLYLKYLIKVAEHERVKKRQNDEAIMLLLIH